MVWVRQMGPWLEGLRVQEVGRYRTVTGLVFANLYVFRKGMCRIPRARERGLIFISGREPGVLANTCNPSTRRLVREDCHELKASLGCIVDSRPTWTT